MQIVIDIPEVFFEAIKNTGEIVSDQRSGKTLMSVIYNAVAKGIPLNGTVAQIDEKWYAAENPKLKTIHGKTGEVVIGGFREVEE